ncbi:MAG: DUF6364 family protein [Thiohalophilus sp.]|uniref:DUF6364 family protein n=1 Tax=Thiohalophilus sp. TaxID=3028392 RepID=UPI002870AE55|nr:DUF6364 family protein [Thiohalophilus sp.]MDR9437593.1 DUF6364 family protein [Thiohalophilus sp.]
MKQNITLSIDKEILTKLKVIAARRSTSVSRLLTEELVQIVRDVDHYEQSRRRALRALDSGFHFGGQPVSRDELHER